MTSSSGPNEIGEAEAILGAERTVEAFARGFTVGVRHRGGARNAAGREVQDQYAAEQITRLFHHDERRTVSVYVERAGDVDVLAVTEAGRLCEEYHQVKTRQEGSSRWSISALRDEGVWREFVAIATVFADSAPTERDLHLVFATDAELSEDLAALREFPDRHGTGAASPTNAIGARSDNRAALLTALIGATTSPARERTVRDGLGKQRYYDLARSVCDAIDDSPDWRASDRRRVDAPLPRAALDAIELAAAQLSSEHAETLRTAAEHSVRHLDFVIRSLRFRSRLGTSDVIGGSHGRPITESIPLTPFEHSIILELARDLQLSTEDAAEAYRTIRSAIDDATVSGAEFSAEAIRIRLGIPEAVPQDEPPAPVEDAVVRLHLALELGATLAGTEESG